MCLETDVWLFKCMRYKIYVDFIFNSKGFIFLFLQYTISMNPDDMSGFVPKNKRVGSLCHLYALGA